MNNVIEYSADMVSWERGRKTTIYWCFIILFDQKSRLSSNLECDNSSNFRRKQNRERARAAYEFSLESRSFPFAFPIAVPPAAPWPLNEL